MRLSRTPAWVRITNVSQLALIEMLPTLTKVRVIEMLPIAAGERHPSGQPLPYWYTHRPSAWVPPLIAGLLQLIEIWDNNDSWPVDVPCSSSEGIFANLRARTALDELYVKPALELEAARALP